MYKDKDRRKRRRRNRIIMILCVKNIDSESPGLIGQYFDKKEYGIVTVELGRNDSLPDMLNGIKGVIILGGPMNVYEEDKYPYLKDEDTFIKKVLDEKVPFLGICLGAQLLAKASGAKVTKAREEEIGFSSVKLTGEGEEDPLFRGLGKEIDVFQWHQDTFGIPSGGTLLAVSEACRNQAFRIGNNAYGLQFHPEMTARMIDDWTLEYQNSREETLRAKRERIMSHYHDKKDNLSINVKRMCENFENIIKA